MISDRHRLPLLGIVVISTIQHLPYLQPWVTGACLLVWIYTFMTARYGWRLPGRPVMIVFSGLLFVAAMTTHARLSFEAFMAFLSLMVVIKVLETKNLRDRMVIVILCYFLLLCGVFFSDSIWATVYKLGAALSITAILVFVNFPACRLKGSLKLAFTIMLQAVPLTLILFLFFPRFQGGIWGRTHLNTAQTGFSDELSFGSVSQIAKDKSPAFRVEFKGDFPEPNLLYWRSIVLWRFDGRKWKRGMNRFSSAPKLLKSSRPIGYTITLEPHNHHWLPALDLPAKIILPRSRLFYDYSAYRWRPVTSRLTYDAESVLVARLPIHPYYKKRALQLPSTGNIRSRELAETLLVESKNNQDYVRRVLRYFKDQPFHYTLTPPVLAAKTMDHNIVDRFLFSSRKGYCEHFAASFAFLMRAAGLPTRVVLGYQGGTFNQFGNYLIIRQSDAHAWCEVWLEEEGWIRVDPTEVVAPERLGTEEAGVSFTLSKNPFFSFWNNLSFQGLLISVQDRLDYYNNMWIQKVMAYSLYEQESFFKNMGISIKSGHGLGQALMVFMVTSILIIIMINLLLLRRPVESNDDAAIAWDNFCRKLSRSGLPRRPDQGPRDYCEYVSANRPDLAGSVRTIVTTYIAIKYGSDTGKKEIIAFRRMIRQFSPGQS